MPLFRSSGRDGQRPRPTAPASFRSFLRLEPLEGREVPATIVGLTAANELVRFDSATPATPIGTPVLVSGLDGGQVLRGIDYRPATGVLYGVSSNSRLYTIDPTTGVATAVGPAFTPALSGTAFGVDFNPVPDRLRVISNTGQNLRIIPTTGAVVNAAADPNLFFDPNDPQNTGYFGTTAGTPITPAPQVTAVAYTQNLTPGTSTTVATQYAIDTARDVLVRVGGPNGEAPSPNTGSTVVVDNITNGLVPIDFLPGAAFDIQAGSDAAFAITGNSLYSINLSTAAATPLGLVGGPAVVGLAVVPATTGTGTVQLSANAAAFTAARTPVALTVTRTGGTAGTVTVNYATVDGTAVAGDDYVPASGTLTFNPGETSRTIALLVPAGPPRPGPEKSFGVVLSTPGGGATLGATTGAVVTIPAVTANPGTANRLIAAGAGSGGRVAVYDSNGGALVSSFAAFEGQFVGQAVVATGDVNGDGTEDVIIGAGGGGGPRVQILDGAALVAGTQRQIASFFAFEANFPGGMTLATGDVNGDGFQDVIVGAGQGGGPRVQAFDGLDLTAGVQTTLLNFFAFEPFFTGGVNVGSGEYTGDGSDDVLVSAQAGGGPRVSIYDGAALRANTFTTVANFFVYDPGFRGGVSVAAGDVNADGLTDIITGAGPGGGPNVRAFDGATLRSSLLAGTQPSALIDIQAYETSFAGGVYVTAADLNRDGFDDLVTGPGRTGGPRLRVFGGQSVNGGQPVLLDTNAFASVTTGGLIVG